MREDLLKGLSEEQIAKVKACKSTKEVLELAKKEDIELTDEQLEAVSGGCLTTPESPKCPKCGSDQIDDQYGRGFGGGITHTCKNCNYRWYN